jgi:hypothetical protein
MAVPVNPTAILSLGMAGLVAWRMYARMRRLIGRQQFSPKRSWLTVWVFPVLIVLLGFASRTQPGSELALLGGMAAGTILGVVGLRYTQFENTPEGFFYTPNAHIGIALSVLLAGRILYRVIHVSVLAIQTAPPAPQFVNSPLTLAIIGTLAGYYVTYAIGLLRWHSRCLRSPVA